MRGVVSARRDLYGRTTSALSTRVLIGDILALLKAGEVLGRLWELMKSFETVDSAFWVEFQAIVKQATADQGYGNLADIAIIVDD